MKINLRAVYKKIGVILLALFLLTMMETAISKTLSTKTNEIAPQQSPLPMPLAEKNIAVHVPEKVVEEKRSESTVPGTLSLEQIHALAEHGQGADVTRGGKVFPAYSSSDTFTQSEAHMSLPEIKKLISSTYDTKPYQKMIDTILAREREYKDDYYVFYHCADNAWRVPQDLYTRLYFHFKHLPVELLKSFIFLRFEDTSGSSDVQSFLIDKLKAGGLINDHELGSFLFAANLALFGNIGVQPECTWQYFIKSRGHLAPSRVAYEKILDKFELPHTYIKALMSLVNVYKTNEQTLLQVFVPKERIDEIGYISWIRGNPAHKKTMDMVLHSVEKTVFPKTASALDYYSTLFKNEQENNPIFKSLMERVKAGDFSLGYFLHFYRNHPELIEGINNFQARLIFTPALLLNPSSGVKIFRYSAATDSQLRNYEQKFDEIFRKIVAEKK